MKRRIYLFAYKIMNDALPFSSTNMVYTPSAITDSPHIAARGAGKWTWTLQRAARTLKSGGKVWIQAEATEWQNLLASRLKAAIYHAVTMAEYGYEKKWLDLHHQSPVFGDYSLAATVGIWFEGAGSEAAALLSPFISTEGFTFTPEEFVDLRERIQAAIRRYERLPDVSRGLEDLNTGFFRHRTLEESQEFISEKLNLYLQRGNFLHRDFLMATNKYTRRSIFSGRSELQERHKEVSNLLAQQHSMVNASGKVGRHTKRTIDQRWKAYCQKHQLTPPTNEPTAVQLRQELASLDQRKSKLFRDLQSNRLGLNALTANPDFIAPEVLTTLEDRLTNLIREVDEAGLYQLPIGRTEAATTHRQMLRLEDLLDKLRNTKRHLPELRDFYGRRHFWYAQPAQLRRLLAPLLNLPTADWETAFSSWYFDRCIEKWTREHPAITTQLPPEKEFATGSSSDPGQSILLANEATLSKEISSEDLLITLDSEVADLPALPCPSVRLAPLHDTDAQLFAVAGLRDPILLFSQAFFPLSPPPWRARGNSMPPPGFPAGTILCQSAEKANWIPISNWPLSSSTVLHLYLPLSPNPSDKKRLLQIWEYLIATSKEITFFHNWTSDDITQALLSDGFTASFLSAALLRAAEAAEFEPFDRQALVAIGQEIQLRCGLAPPTPHPLAENFGKKLSNYLPTHFFEIHQPWRDTYLPLVILSPAGKKSVLLPDGKLPGYSSPETEENRLLELRTAGFHLVTLPAAGIWADPEGELLNIAEEVRQIG